MTARPITGRVTASPARLLHEHTLGPQFALESERLFPAYLRVERVLLVEYLRMGVLSEAEVTAVAGALDELAATDLVADPDRNLSDISLAVERLVDAAPGGAPPRWHLDRSRNDAQACAQLMYGRDELLAVADGLHTAMRTALDQARESADVPMPGYTQMQAAQVVSPGFYLAALVEHGLRTLRRLRGTYDELNRCPLGAGAMSGQELDWDRDAMARLLGFAGPQPHALTSVASRAWSLETVGELSHFGVGLSRFLTDLMTWAGATCGFVVLPDELAGISAAMPQKRNYPVLERIRGRTAHLTSAYQDLVLGQRNTPYTNMIEVSKESARQLDDAFRATRSILELLTAVLTGLSWRPEVMRAACDREFLGGMTLANRLTEHAGLPWRTAQVVSGRYIAGRVAAGAEPSAVDGAALAALAAEAGGTVTDPQALAGGALDTDGQFAVKRSAGSASPAATRALLDEQDVALRELAGDWAQRRSVVAATDERIAAALTGADGRVGAR
ncbi:argininosuccinate lyase [Paractinoplanes hotanensis]|uniref:Lyase family protein n=1 Tax=Paractinoplanes hotanensis TaxID=2906497 RepID=A0ABT0YAN3_9ACTN|nr:lyase family protein [Actinoplanes hotanensis]MCM4083110.1 lyase family protein [Actinoplanes hotanensis]